MVTSVYTTFTLDELSLKQQAKAHDIYIEKFLENNDFDYFVIENNSERLYDLGFYDVKIYYSGFYNQGSWAYFEGEIGIYDYLYKVVGKEIRDKYYTNLCLIDPDYLGTFEILERNECIYVTVDDYMDRQDLSNDQYQELERLRIDCLNYVKEQNKIIYKELLESYEYYISVDGFKEFVSNNNIKFFAHENGTIIYCFE